MEPLGCPPWAQCQCCSAAGVAPKSRLRILRMTAQLRPDARGSERGAAECRVPLASAPCAEVSWARWEAVKARIDAGEIILMDGGTGTEVERRVKELGDPTAVDVIGWSAVQALLHPEMCETVHTDYLGVGAEVLIANTYASNRMILNATGFGEKVAETNAQACEAANAARTKAGSDDTLVVGSISCHPPHVKSEDEGGASETGGWPSEAEQSAAFLEQAQMLAAGGVDALFIEMITGKDRGLRCVEAACKVGLPVFVGLVCSRDRNAANILEKPAALSEGTAVEEVVPAMLALDGAENIVSWRIIIPANLGCVSRRFQRRR